MLLTTSHLLLSLLSASPAQEPLCAGRAPCSDPERQTSQAWEVASLKGAVNLSKPSCEDGEESLGERALPSMPRLQVDPAYLHEGWKQTALGGDALFLEVRDDHWTGPSDKWLADDHVDLWIGPIAPGEMKGCGKPKDDERPVQWGIRVTDGKVSPADGSPSQPLAVEKVELREADKVVGYRLKVTLPGEVKAITVVYSATSP